MKNNRSLSFIFEGEIVYTVDQEMANHWSNQNNQATIMTQ